MNTLVQKNRNSCFCEHNEYDLIINKFFFEHFQSDPNGDPFKNRNYLSIIKETFFFFINL